MNLKKAIYTVANGQTPRRGIKERLGRCSVCWSKAKDHANVSTLGRTYRLPLCREHASEWRAALNQ